MSRFINLGKISRLLDGDSAIQTFFIYNLALYGGTISSIEREANILQE
jgi:hypothetical protein